MVLEAGLEQHKQVEPQGQLQVVSRQLVVFEQQVVDNLLAAHVQLVVVQLVGGKSLEHHRTLNLQFGP